MKKFILYSLYIYLGTLAVTQTVYGKGFINIRWLALVVLTFFSGVYWVSARSKGVKGVTLDETAGLMTAYLSATLLTVFTAENPLFSGLRWASHAMMFGSLMIFIRQSVRLDHVRRIFICLKILTGALIVISFLKPAPTNIYDNLQIFRGAMGNANTMGQIAAIGAVMYFHGFMFEQKRNFRYLYLCMVFVSAWVVWWTGSRSSMIALMTGMGIMTFFYHIKMRKRIYAAVIVVFLIALNYPGLPREAKRFILKKEDANRAISMDVVESRAYIWRSAWDGFKERPFLGWGFGADSGIKQDWDLKLTALGTVERDPVNDLLFMLEGCGIVGFFAYLLLISIVWKQRPRQSEILKLRQMSKKSLWFQDRGLEALHFQAIMFTLSLCLLVMVQFDNTALSAGNYISVVLWVGACASGVLRRHLLPQGFIIRSTDPIRAQVLP